MRTTALSPQILMSRAERSRSLSSRRVAQTQRYHSFNYSHLMTGEYDSMSDPVSFIFLLGLLWSSVICLVKLVSIPFAIISTIRQSYCPDCRQYFRLKRFSTILVPPSFQAQGKRRFTRYCSRCSYHRESEAVIPVRVMEDARCPSCYELSNLGRTERTLVESTYVSEGKKQVARRCSHCDHRWEYEEAISKLCYVEPP
jgi:hypothetical protein